MSELITLDIPTMLAVVKYLLFVVAGVSAIRWEEVRKGFLTVPAISTLVGLLAAPTLMKLAGVTIGGLVAWIPVVGEWLAVVVEAIWMIAYPLLVAAYLGAALVAIVTTVWTWNWGVVKRWLPMKAR
jgi:hypothetical protein